MSKFASTTIVPVSRSRAEIEETLKRFGASHFAYMDQPNKATIAFRTRDRNVRFDLPFPPAKQFKSPDAASQDLRSRWRALLLCIKAKLTSVENGIETFEQAFMAHVVLPSGRTVGEEISPKISVAYQNGSDVPLLQGPKQ